MRSKRLRVLEKRLRQIVGILANELVRLFVPRRETKTTLVIRLDAIGDFLIWLGAGAADTAEVAAAHGRSILLAKRDWAVFAGSLNLFDEIWPVDIERFKFDPYYRIQLLAALRRRGFSTVIQPRAAREFLLEDSVIRVCGARTIIGNQGSARNIAPWLKRISDRWYTKLIEVPSESAHEMERSRAFARGLVGREPRAFTIDFDDQTPQRFGLVSPYFIVAPGAGWAGRCWPATRFGEIALRLQRETGYQCVILGGEGDRALAASIANVLEGRCLDLTGATSLMETGALLKQAQLAIVNESGLSHFAPFVGTKAVVLLGGGHFGWFMPYKDNMPVAVRPLSVYHPMECYGCNWKCKFDVPSGTAVPCVEQISIDDVWAGVKQIISKPPTPEAIT